MQGPGSGGCGEGRGGVSVTNQVSHAPCRFVKVDTPWRKAQDRLAGEEEYEALDKIDRLEVYQEHIR